MCARSAGFGRRIAVFRLLAVRVDGVGEDREADACWRARRFAWRRGRLAAPPRHSRRSLQLPGGAVAPGPPDRQVLEVVQRGLRHRPVRTSRSTTSGRAQDIMRVHRDHRSSGGSLGAAFLAVSPARTCRARPACHDGVNGSQSSSTMVQSIQVLTSSEPFRSCRPEQPAVRVAATSSSTSAAASATAAAARGTVSADRLAAIACAQAFAGGRVDADVPALRSSRPGSGSQTVGFDDVGDFAARDHRCGLASSRNRVIFQVLSRCHRRGPNITDRATGRPVQQFPLSPLSNVMVERLERRGFVRRGQPQRRRAPTRS